MYCVAIIIDALAWIGYAQLLSIDLIMREANIRLIVLNKRSLLTLNEGEIVT